MCDNVIDITTIKNGGSLRVEREYCLIEADYTANIRLLGDAVNSGYMRYIFTGSLEGSIEACCARCLAPVAIAYSSDIEFCFTCSSDFDEEALFFTGSLVDFRDVVAGFIKADAPISFLCGEDCKGLCQKCGCDLNAERCGCEKDLLNPVLDKLNFN